MKNIQMCTCSFRCSIHFDPREVKSDQNQSNSSEDVSTAQLAIPSLPQDEDTDDGNNDTQDDTRRDLTSSHLVFKHEKS
jgi:hypothetical protein